MKILLLAPHPFFQNRGTPIAVDLVLKTLSNRGECIDVITYHEGSDIYYPNVTVYRTPKPPFVGNIRPGFSGKKLICDVFMFFKVLRLLIKNRYDLVHAGEEAVFIALLLKVFLKIPYVYDMDSSLAQQIVEKFPRLGFLSAALSFFEKLAVQNAEVVIPVCEALAEDIEKYKPRKIVVLPDISLLSIPT